jgi:hypothetical protein
MCRATPRIQATVGDPADHWQVEGVPRNRTTIKSILAGGKEVLAANVPRADS